MIVRVGIAVTCSIAAFTLNQLKNKREDKDVVPGCGELKISNKENNCGGIDYESDYIPEDVPKSPEEKIKRVDQSSPTHESSVRNGGEEHGEQGYLLPELDAFFSGGLRSPNDLPRRGLPGPRSGLSPNLLSDEKRNSKVRPQDRDYVEVLHRTVVQKHSETLSDGNPCSRQLFKRCQEAKVPVGSGCAGTRSGELVETLSGQEVSHEGGGTPIMTPTLGVPEGRPGRKLDYLELHVDTVDHQLAWESSVQSTGSSDDKYVNEATATCNVTVIEMLKNTVAELKEREMKLEGELLEYYGLQEREDEYFEIKQRFEEQAGTIEAQKLQIEKLEAEARGLVFKIAGGNKMQLELADARARIQELEKRSQKEVGQYKAEIAMLKQKISTLKVKEDEMVRRDTEIEKRLQTLREVEVEVIELRRTSMDNQHQRRELTIKLSAAEAQIAQLSKSNEHASVAHTEVKTDALRQANERLIRQVEGLQNSRFSEVEELVYLRWVNACLRYELRNFQATSGKPTALDLNKNLSPRSQAMAKQLMLEHAGSDLSTTRSNFQSESGYESTTSESSIPHESDGVGDFSDPSSDLSSGRISRKPGLIRRLKKWTGRRDGKRDGGRDGPSGRGSFVDRDKTNPEHQFHGEFESRGPFEAFTLRTCTSAVEISTYRASDTGDDSPTRSETSSNGIVEKSSLDIYRVKPNLPPVHTKPAEIELKGVAASFQLMSKSVLGSELDGKYPAFKDRHKAALEREKSLKEKAAIEREKTTQEKAAIEREKTHREKPATEGEEATQEKAAIEGEKTTQEKAAIEGEKITHEKTEFKKEGFSVEKIEQRSEQKASATRYNAGDLMVTNSVFFRSLDADFRPDLTTNFSKRVEIAKKSPAEVEKRPLRKSKPAPKRSSSGPCVATPTQGRKVSGMAPGPPPPPPPPPRTPGVPCPPPPPPTPGSIMKSGNSEKMQRAPGVVEFYQSLMKRDAKCETSAGGAGSNPEARNNMIGEIEKRSTHLLAIKADVETQGEFVESLASEVRAASFNDVGEVVEFVNWLDDELSFLVDERAVLKHFDWPEGKADALREASFEYRDLKKLQDEVSAFEDKRELPCDAALKNILKCLEKMEQSVYALLRTRDMAIARYKDFGVPTQWMLDTGLVGKIKEASVRLARLYMKRVSGELDLIVAGSEKEPLREFLLLQGVRFAFRVHQFAGGFDAESMAAFEALRNRAHKQSSSPQESP